MHKIYTFRKLYAYAVTSYIEYFKMSNTLFKYMLNMTSKHISDKIVAKYKYILKIVITAL